MKAFLFFCVIIIASTSASLYVVKSMRKAPVLVLQPNKNEDVQLTKIITKNLLNKFLNEQRLIKINHDETKENILYLKSNTNKPTQLKHYEYYYQYDEKNYAQGY